MSFLKEVNVLAIKAAKKNADYWKERCLKAEFELDEMRNKYEAPKPVNDSVTTHPPSRLSMDPLKVMPAHCLNLILHNLTGKEVLKAREVSSEWCNFVEGEKNLMEPAIKSTKVLVQSRKDPDYLTIRKLKNLEIHRSGLDDYCCIDECMRTVENLKIIDGPGEYVSFRNRFNFSALCKLEVVIGDPQWFTLLEDSSFPVLSEYKLVIFRSMYDNYENRYDLNSKVLKNMPSLKRYSIYEHYPLNPEYNAPFPFQLEFVFSNYVPTSLITNQAEWVKELQVDKLETADLHTIELMSQLKTLRVGELYRNVPHEIRHVPDEAMEEFLIYSVTILEFGERNSEDDKSDELMAVLLRGLPSVETFIYHRELNEKNLRSIASTLPKLETLCSKLYALSSDVLEVYREMQDNEVANNVINTNFKIIIMLRWKTSWHNLEFKKYQELPQFDDE